MLPITVAEAVVAARQSDARNRAQQARLREIARSRTAGRSTPKLPAQPRRRFRWHRRPIIRPA